MTNKQKTLSQAKFTQLVFNSTVEGIWTIGLDGRITSVNKAAVKMFGYASESEMLGKNSHELVHYKRANGSHYPQVECPIYKAFQKGISVFLEDEVLWRLDGTSFFAEYRSVPIIEEGQILGAVVTFIDNTEKRKAQAEILLQGQRITQILEQLPMPFYTIASDWTITYVNPAAAILFQTDQAAAQGKNLWKLFPELEQTIAGQEFKKAANRRVRVNFEFYYPPFNKWYLAYAYPHEVDYIAVAFLEITDRKKAELNLAIEQRRVEDMVALSPAGIALMRGPNFVFELVNSKWRELVSDREYVGKPWSACYPEIPDSPLPAILTKVYKTGVPYKIPEMQIRVEVSAGVFENRFYDISYFRVLDTDEQPYGIFSQCSDITQRVRDKKAMQETVKSLKTQRDLREHFVAALSHDLRTPLTAAKMSVQMLASKTRDELGLQKLIQRASSNLNRADQMIRDLLDANRIKAGEGVPIAIEEVQLDEVMKDTIKELTELHGPYFRLNLSEAAIVGHWDRSSIRRIVENLAGNAVKYGRPGTPVTIAINQAEGDCEISVHNDGNPITANDQKTLFDPWRRAPSALATCGGSWGMGLTLVKGIVEAHGGSARVESNAEKGTTFSVRLPLDNRRQA